METGNKGRVRMEGSAQGLVHPGVGGPGWSQGCTEGPVSCVKGQQLEAAFLFSVHI